jgi:hypothetical protein
MVALEAGRWNLGDTSVIADISPLRRQQRA